MVRLLFTALCLGTWALGLSACDPVGTVDPRVPECSGDPASPLSTDLVLETLRAEGFTVHPVERSYSGVCGNPGVVAELTNDEGAARREGSLHCSTLEAPRWDKTLQTDLDALAPSPPFRDLAAFWLANVECGIYPDGDDKDGQIARLQRAMEALEAQL